MSFSSFVKKIWQQKYSFALLTIWSFLVLVSAVWNIHENYRSTFSKALVEAKTIFQHNLAYRRWNSMHSGVYAKVTEINQPNPLIVRGDRDILAQDGSRLTMINPFQMTVQAYNLLKKQSPELAVFNRTVSLVPLNPLNTPDKWEEKALLGFEEGKGALSEITTIEGAPYMRLISPYVTEKRCLSCHEHQGYEVGDIRGGMSVAVPMQPYYQAAASERKIIGISHMILWTLGTGTIVLLLAGLRKYQTTIDDNEEKFRIVSEFAYNFEYWINSKKELAFISPSCKRITGYSRKEFMNKSQLMFDMIHPDDKGMFRNHLMEFDEPVHEDMEYRIITKDGQTRWMSHTCSPIYVDGRFFGRRGSNRDITDNKRLEEELMQAKKVEDLGHFAGVVAHDFNNVLASISTITQLMKGKIDEEDGFLHQYVNYITIAAKLGQNLTSNLLMFGRRKASNPQQARLSEIINNIDQVIGSLLSDGIKCSIVLTENEHDVLVDPHQVEQVLINLATNARDAMPAGGDLSIETSFLSLSQKKSTVFGEIPADDYMILSVSDTGSGITETDLANIFEPFYSTKSSNKGTGLGLSIVNNIVKEHKGFVDVDSVLQKGTTFRLFFPLYLEANQQPDEQQNNKKGVSGKETVLVVDDDWLIRKSLLIFLQDRGYTVLLAADGKEAIRQYQKHRKSIGLVVLDVMLPQMDGKEVYDSLTKRGKMEIKVLFISGSTVEVLEQKGILANQFDYQAKPLDLEDFGSKVDEMLQR